MNHGQIADVAARNFDRLVPGAGSRHLGSFYLTLPSETFNGRGDSDTQDTYGRRLMTSIIIDLACSSPRKSFMSIPVGDGVTDGQKDISCADVAQAIN